jgi:MFS family permease
VWPIYALAAVGASIGAFDLPARQALVPTLVPRQHLPNAIALNSIMLQLASVVGPSVGGLLIAASGVAAAYVANALSFVFVISALLMMRDLPAPGERGHARDDMSVAAAVEGLRFVFRSPLIRSTMVLDFLVTFFASATALLPIYAQDILDVGPIGLGFLRTAPSAGAAIIAVVLARQQIQRHAGLWMFACVALFGAATVVFGLSTNYYVSLLALVVVGGADMVSVYVRSAMIQLATPDHMRGRVGSLNSLFVGASNELGEFRAGMTAGAVGTVPAVVIGGVGAVVVVGVWMRLFPELRRVDRFSDVTVQ